MLTGTDLLARVKELGDAPKSELVRECGYVSTKKDGAERLNFTAFYEALLEAKGLNIGTQKAGRRGRALSHVARVQFNGNLLIGKAYTQMMDLQPGDEFEIKLGKKQIRLIPIGDMEFAEGEDTNDLPHEDDLQEDGDEAMPAAATAEGIELNSSEWTDETSADGDGIAADGDDAFPADWEPA